VVEGDVGVIGEGVVKDTAGFGDAELVFYGELSKAVGVLFYGVEVEKVEGEFVWLVEGLVVSFESCFVLWGEVIDVEGAAAYMGGVFSEVGVGGEEVEFDEAGECFGDGVVVGNGGKVEFPVLVAVEVVVVGVGDDGLLFSGG